VVAAPPHRGRKTCFTKRRKEERLMGRVEGKIALITGAARGQGRSHALRLASEGAQIIAVDVCDQIASVPYPMSAAEDLAQTAKLIEELDQRAITCQADVRSSEQMRAAVEIGLAEFGHIDIVCANAGINSLAQTQDITDDEWQDMLDVNLTGVWRTVKAVLPSMIERNQGGSIIMTSSIFGLSGSAGLSHYSAAKHGVVGLMRSMVNEVSKYKIRVNTVHPTTVDTDMCQNEMTYKLFCPEIEHPTKADCAERMRTMNAMDLPWVDPIDISNAVLYLASDEARYVTGVTLPVDAGFLAKTS
jgi:SDR family mycofactocin-dependent oxidoreductase